MQSQHNAKILACARLVAPRDWSESDAKPFQPLRGTRQGPPSQALHATGAHLSQEQADRVGRQHHRRVCPNSRSSKRDGRRTHTSSALLRRAQVMAASASVRAEHTVGCQL
eukprot:2187269-Pleurochrysis_carterae.AAC.2